MPKDARRWAKWYLPLSYDWSHTEATLPLIQAKKRRPSWNLIDHRVLSFDFQGKNLSDALEAIEH